MSNEVNVSVIINVPDELYQEARSIAEAERASVDDVVTSALACHLAAWRHLRERAPCGYRHKFLAVLEKVKGIERKKTIVFRDEGRLQRVRPHCTGAHLDSH